MRLWMILGGLVGFLIGLGFGLAQESAWPTILWRASVAACLGGFVLRWWGSVWMNSLYEAEQERLNAPPKEARVMPAPKGRL